MSWKENPAYMPRRLPVSPCPPDLAERVEALTTAIEALGEKIHEIADQQLAFERRTLNAVELLRCVVLETMPRVPLSRRYTLKEAGVRLGSGVPPEMLTPAEAKKRGISLPLMKSYVAEPDGFGATIKAIRDRTGTWVTERAIRDYEDKLERQAELRRKGQTGRYTFRTPYEQRLEAKIKALRAQENEAKTES